MKILIFLFASALLAQTPPLPIGVPLLDFSKSTQTRPFAVYASVGALPASGCVPDSYAAVTGNGIYRNSGTGTCVWTPAFGANSIGAIHANQSSDGSGGFLDNGCTTASATENCSGGFTTGGAFYAAGPHQTPPTALGGVSSIGFFNTSNLDHYTREDPAGLLHDLEPIRRIAGYVFDGAGSPLSGTLDACVDVPAAALITGVTLLGDQSGSVTVDVKTVAYGSYTGPGSASSITASAVPALSSAVKYQDTTLTGWTTTVAANTIMCFHLTSPTTVTWAMIDVKGTN